MDPMTIIFLVTAALGVVDSIAQEITRKVKEGQNVSIDELKSYINRSLSQAYAKSTTKGDRLANQLSALSIVQRTPALSSAVDSMHDRIQREQSQLNDDISTLNILEADSNLKIAEAEDHDVFGRQNQINLAKEAINKNVSKIKEIEKRL